MSHSYVFVTLEHFSQTKEYLLLTVLEKVGKKRELAQAFKFPAQVLYK